MHCYCWFNVKFLNCWSPCLDHTWTRILFEVNGDNWNKRCWGVSDLIWCFHSVNATGAYATSCFTNNCYYCDFGCCLQCPLLLPHVAYLACSSPACCQHFLFLQPEWPDLAFCLLATERLLREQPHKCQVSLLWLLCNFLLLQVFFLSFPFSNLVSHFLCSVFFLLLLKVGSN